MKEITTHWTIHLKNTGKQLYKKRTASIIVFIFILVNIFGVNAFALEEKYAENPVLKFAYDESLNKANIVDDILYSLYSTDSNELIDRIVEKHQDYHKIMRFQKVFLKNFRYMITTII